MRAELEGRGVSTEVADRLIASVQFDEGDNDAVLNALGERLAGSERGSAGVADLRRLLELSDETRAGRFLKVDPFLARGLSYYTGAIFEISVADLAGSLGGGGRYDNLVGMFLGRPIPACGFSLGLERIIVVMEERGMFGDVGPVADVMVGVWNESLLVESLKLARELRDAGLCVDLFPDLDKVGKQFKYADSRGYAHVALVGPDEAAQGTVAIKTLKTGEQVAVDRASVAAWLRDARG